YTGTRLGGVFFTLNEGTGWAQLTDGLTDHVINAVAVESGPTMEVVYAGSRTAGVFRLVSDPTATTSSTSTSSSTSTTSTTSSTSTSQSTTTSTSSSTEPASSSSTTSSSTTSTN